MKSGIAIWKQMIVMLAAVLIAGVIAVVLPEPVRAADIASGSSGNYSWVVDADGNLTVTGTGDFERMNEENHLPVPIWLEAYGVPQKIKTAKIISTGMTDASYLLWGCQNLESVDLSECDMSSVTNMSNMFCECNSLTTVDLSGSDMSSVTDMSCMFENCSSLTTVDLSGSDMSSVTDMSCMFENCSSLTTVDLSGSNTSSVTVTAWMFGNCTSLKTLDLSSFNTGNVSIMSMMFSGCTSLTTINLSSFNTKSVEYMGYMFRDCTSLTTLDLSSFDTKNIYSLYGMFSGCTSLTTLDLSSFDTSKVECIGKMFKDCTSLTTLDLSSFDLSKVTESGSDNNGLFSGCTSLTTIYAPKNAVINFSLPTDDDSTWYLSDGTAVTKLPKNLSYSVAIGKNYIPTEKEGKIVLSSKNTTVTLSATSLIYTGKAQKPTVTVTDSNAKKISSKNYMVSYENNKNVGKATLTITFKGSYVGTITKSFKIVPKATTLGKVTSSKSKTLTVKWAKQATQTTGYEIQYATDSKFTKNLKTVTVSNAKTTSKTISKLTTKKNYYVRIRTYKTVSGTKYYSSWSKATSVTTK